MIRKFLAVLLCMLTAVAFMPVSAFAGTTTTVKEEDPTHTYYTKIGLDPYTYYDVGGGAKKTLDDTVIKGLVKDHLIYDWANIANGCFRTAGDCASLDSDRFDFAFNNGSDNIPKCFGEIRAYLRDEEGAVNKGTKKGDSLTKTGIKVAGSLGEVRQKMAKEICDNIDRYSLDRKRDEFMKLGPKDPNTGKSSALWEMDDSKNDTVVYSIVTSINNKSNLTYQYNSFGICFYDFHPRAIQADDLKYKAASDGYETPEEAKEKGAPGVKYSDEDQNSYGAAATNSSAGKASYSLEYSNGDEESNTNYTETSSEKSYGQTINIKTQWGGDSSFLLCWLCKLDVGASFTFNQMYSQTEGHSKTETHSTIASTTTNVDVEPQTSVMLRAATANATLTTDYDTPVMVSYKVMIFSMTGHMYADSAYTCNFYGHGCYLNQIGAPDTPETLKFGTSATENLYQRAYLDSGRDDTSFGAPVHRFVDETGQQYDDTSEGVKWYKEFLKDDGPTRNSVENQALNAPMLSCGCYYTATSKTIKSDINDHVPLYLPAMFRLENNSESDKATYEMTTGDRMNLSSSLDVSCLNRNEVSYYGYKKSDCQWEVCDEYGAPVTESCISVAVDGVGNQILTADSAGVGHITWKMKENVVYKAEKDEGEITRSDNLQAPIIEFDVKNVPFEGSVVVEGEFKGCVGDEGLNLNKIMTAKVYDSHQKQVSRPVGWEAQELEEYGIKVDEDGSITLTKAGKFHICAVVRNTGSGVEDIYSPWVEITASPKRELTAIQFADTLNTPEALAIDPTVIHQYDLMSYLKGYDQYGDPWEGDLSGVSFELDGNADNAVIQDGMLRINDDCDVQVKASIGSVQSEPADMSFVVPDSIENANVVLSKEAFTYNGKVQKPKVVSVTTEKGKPLKEGEDYTVTMESSRNAGEYAVSVEGAGDYYGEAKAFYRIDKADIAKAFAAKIKNTVYTGKVIKKAPTVKLGGVTLKKGTDYTLTYKDAKQVGNAIVLIEGKGNFYGMKTVSYKIIPKKAGISGVKADRKKMTVKMSAKVGKTGGTKYKVQYKIKGKKAWKTKYTTKQSLTIKSLKKGKKS